ncbi:glycoside hydrolase family 32 protein [Glutamicibacter mysorens]|uniref:glycoside hydrolase family 32 protein n=1 Tax=Glutamicibacter mysorens TaxID=257984 RepID=UPI0020C68369|nr:glycoside hydrolase family 32 protein [Glutamicibacter mysorens]UTM46688.1 glycoside hydrolase family 32 protein [Glutamicibacter mysorens]
MSLNTNNVANAGPSRRSIVATMASATALGLNGLGASAANAVPLRPRTETENSVSSAMSYRPSYHFSVPDNWKNDPQRPIYLDGEYLYYYLYNEDYILGGTGTSWRLTTTTDHVNFTDQGVAISKHDSPNGDCWSGSIVIDENNTAGYGKNALIALVTQAPNNEQAQFLWYSTDKGRTFKPGGTKPVLPNPGQEAFRDPKVIWHEPTSRWVMLNAEGDRIGIYVSRNLKQWKHTSEFVRTTLGILECPDLFQMQATDGTKQWVLGTSANGKPRDLPATYAYWLGEFDGKTFTTAEDDPQWLDWGYDFYGAVTYPDHDEDGSVNPALRRAIGWNNFWDYPHNAPSMATDGYNGDDMIVREVRMVAGPNGNYLASVPVAQLDRLARATTKFGSPVVSGEKILPFSSSAYVLQCELQWDPANPPENIGFELCRAVSGTRHVATGLYLAGGFAYVNRKPGFHPGDKGESKSPLEVPSGKLDVRILVDRSSVEVFFGDGRLVHSHRVFPLSTDAGIKLFVSGGKASYKNLTARELGFA